MTSPRLRTALPLAGLLLLALALRLPGMAEQPLSGDEAMHLQPLSLLQAVLLDLRHNPPLFRLLLQPLLALSATPAVARLLPLAAGLVTIALAYAAGRTLSGHSAGLLAALFLTFQPWHVRHCQTLRAYSLLTLLLAASALVTLRSRHQPLARTGLVLHGTIAALAAATHYLALPYLALEALLLWSWHRRTHATIHLGSAALVTLLFAGALWSGSADKLARAQVADHLAGLPFVTAALRALLAPGGLALLSVAGLAGWACAQRDSRAVALWTLWPLVVAALLGLFMPVEIRYVLPALFGVALLVGTGTVELARRWHHASLLAGLLWLFLLAGNGLLLTALYQAPTDPARANGLHRDLVHMAEPLGPLLLPLEDSREPLCFVARGPLEHRLVVALSQGTYPAQLPRRDDEFGHRISLPERLLWRVPEERWQEEGAPLAWPPDCFALGPAPPCGPSCRLLVRGRQLHLYRCTRSPQGAPEVP